MRISAGKCSNLCILTIVPTVKSLDLIACLRKCYFLVVCLNELYKHYIR